MSSRLGAALSAFFVPVVLLVFCLPATGFGQDAEAISFTYEIGGTVPAPVQRDLYSQPPVVVTLVPDGAAWVSATVSNPSTPCVLTISAVPGNLPAGTYTSTLKVDSNQGYLIYNITLTVTGGTSSGGIALSASSFTFTAIAGGAVPAAQTLTVTAGASVSANAQASQQSCTGSTWLSLSPTGSFSAGTVGKPFTISVDPASLTAGTTCSGTISITAASVTLTASVTLNVVAAGGLTLSASSITFYAIAGGPAPAPQLLIVAAPSNTSATVQASRQSCVSSDWLTVSPTGNFTATASGASVTVSANPSGLPAGTTCAGTITFTTGSTTWTVSVELNVTAITSNDVTVSASVLTFSVGAGNPTPAALTFSVAAPFTLSASIQVSQQSCTGVSWLSVEPTGSFTVSPAASVFTVSVNQSGMGVGATCNGAVTITAGSITKVIPVNLSVIWAPSAALTMKPSSLTFEAFAGIADPPSQTLVVTAPYDAAASVKVTENSCTGANWLTVSPMGSFTANQSGTTFTVSVTASGIPAGSYCWGTINMTNTIGTWGTTVLLKVSAAAPTQISPSSFTFSATAGGAAPAPQTLSVTAQAGASIAVVATAQTCTDINWLSLLPSGSLTAGTAPAGFTVSVDQLGLGAGASCRGILSVTTNSGTRTLPVTLVVTEAQTPLSATPAGISFTHEAGRPGPAPQILSVSGGGRAGTFRVATTGTSWLRVSPSCTAASPCTVTNDGTFDLTVAADPAALNTGATDSAIISVIGVGQTVGSVNVGISFTRTATAPAIALVTNAASYLTGPVAPGEMIAIFGKPANPIGPDTASSLNDLTCPAPCTSLPTRMDGVEVIFQPGGVRAPLTYVSSKQVNCLVPYEILDAPAVGIQVSYLGQVSDVVALQYAATQPGIFTALGTGTGLVSAQQYDTQGNYSGKNSSDNPASPGWFITFYATGEGMIPAPAVTGNVTNVGPVLPLMGPPSVTIDNLPATVAYFAEAEGFVAGVMQINAVIPAAVRLGQTVSLSLAMGGRYSQPGVVLYMK